MIPEDLHYTEDHEWVRTVSENTVRIGITDYAQRQLGDVVYVEPPTVGQRANAGEALGTIESVKAVSELYAPVSGQVASVNTVLADEPELVNTEPYNDGWMVEIRLDGLVGDALTPLLNAETYRSLTERS
ncbi:MAG: glycine cleavage system protein GcvH [Pseudonocardia sp.]|nr:glycine cleavage system protein GcvH [Pseudonocardia sp.]